MKKIFYIILILPLVITLNCSNKNKKLATFKNGDLKYYELEYHLSKLPENSKKEYTGSFENLKKLVEDLTLKKIVMQYAKDTNIINWQNLNNEFEIYKRREIVNYMIKKLIGSIEASASPGEIEKWTSTLDVSLIWLKTHRGMTKKQLSQIKKKAYYIKKLLNKGENFGKLANVYTDDLNNYKNGFVVPVKENEISKEILNIIKKLKTNEISQPTITSNGFEIIKLINYDKSKKTNLISYQHILIKTNKRGEKETFKLANEIYNQLKKGTDFSLLANKWTEDESNFMNGKIPSFLFSRVYYPISDAAYKLKIGEISKPIETKYGFFIIKLENKKTLDKNRLKRLKQDKNFVLRIKEAKERYLKEEKEYKISRKIFNYFNIIEHYENITNKSAFSNNPVIVEIIDKKNSLKIFYNDCINIISSQIGTTFNFDFITKQEKIYNELVYPKIAYTYALKKGIDKDNEIQLALKDYYQNKVYQEVLNNLKFEIPEPTKEELLKIYTENPNDYIVTKVIKGKPEKVKLSFNEALELLKSKYKNIKRENEINNFLKNLKTKYELKIYPENFKIEKNYKYYLTAGDEYYYKQKNYKKALKFYKKAFKNEPLSSFLKLKLFVTYLKLNEKDKANEIYRDLQKKFSVKISEVVSILTNETGKTKLKLIELLGYTGSDLAVPHLLQIYTQSTNIEEIQIATRALGMLEPEDFFYIAIDDLKDFNKKFSRYNEKDKNILKWYLIEALGNFKKSEAVPLLLDLYKSTSDNNEKCFIIEALGKIKDKSTVNFLEDVLKKEVWGIKVLAAEALKNITGKEYKVEEPPKKEKIE